MSEDHAREAGARKVAELAGGIKVAMLTTRDEHGHLVSRPMAHQQVEPDADLWFFAERDSRKVRHITVEPHVGVALSSNDAWVSLDGEAHVVDDPAKARELWNAVVGAWMPQGPEDPSVVLIKVVPRSAEYWDSPGAVATAVSFVKAKVTGERFEGGDHGVVEL